MDTSGQRIRREGHVPYEETAIMRVTVTGWLQMQLGEIGNVPLVDPDAALHGYLEIEIGQSVLSDLELERCTNDVLRCVRKAVLACSRG